MEYPTLQFVFDRKKQASKTKTGLVQIEVKSGSQRKWIGTGVRVYAGQWHKSGRVCNRLDSEVLNDTLLSQFEHIANWINELRRNKEPFDFEKLTMFLANKEQSSNFIEYLENRIDERGDISDSTKRSHRKLIHSLQAFGKIRYFSDLTKQNIIEYDEWLHKKNYVQTTIHSYHKFLKTYVHDAMRRDLLKDDPYTSVKIDRGKSAERKYLTEQELNNIRQCVISDKSLSKVRDVFVFQCFTGLAYADLAKFDFTKVEERDGRYILHSVRQKSGEDYYLVLLSPAVEILKKYDFELPVITNQQYNLRLKIVASLANIDRNLTSHMARHTFAVYCLNHNIKIETLAKMMGRTDIKTTQLYAKIVNKTVESAFDSLEQTLK